MEQMLCSAVFDMVRTTRAAGGFSLIELLVVVALIAIAAGIAIPISDAMVIRAKADSTSREVMSWLEDARSRATAERRNFEVVFDTATNRISVSRVEPGGARTPILNRPLPDQMTFSLGGMPDTPDGFGNATAVDFDGVGPHMFTGDGSFTDAAGDISNGTIYIGRGSETDTGRAITIFGATGMMRSFKRSGVKWSE
jgi:prepilin-type N-terminal cleavage/methylation domain-containing protein